MYVKCRPHLFDFLESVTKQYEVIVYCAGSQLYCSHVLDYIERDKQYFAHRLYNTHVLFESAQYSIKYYDFLLSKPRSRDNTVIVETAVSTYSLLLYNGLPIEPFTTYLPDQDQLMWLASYLDQLARLPSVYEEINAIVQDALD